VLFDTPDHGLPPKHVFRRVPDVEVAQTRRREQSRILKREARQKMTPEQREQQRANDRERKKAARLNTTPEQRANDRERKKAARLNATPEQRERQREKARQRSGNRLRPFWGVDGEGGGTDDKGRQHYNLMAASGPGADEHRSMHRDDGGPPSVREQLEFLLSLPRDPILVGFAFGYDANQIIRGIGRIKTLQRIIHPRQGPYGPRSTFWGDYAITWQPWQYFRVSRVDRSGPKPVTDPSTTRTVYDVFAFFQTSFVVAINNWNIGTEQERAFVAENKAKREDFDGVTAGMIDYCTLECRLLASLMSAFREVCIAADIVPARWSGPGWIAARLLEKHGIPKRPQTANEALLANAGAPQLRRPVRDPEFEKAASLAFYGGRFEVSRIGHIPGPVYEYDLNSAYPAVMPGLPCSMHTRWVHRPNARRLPKSGLYLAKITFDHLRAIPWCGLPFRRKNNSVLYWPYQGTGWYWSCEIEAAQRYLFADVSVHDLWVAERTCDCRQYDWVPALYEKRRQLGSKTQGYPLKLGLNSLYGKMAQRSGRGPYHDLVAAGLVTATTRARLIEALWDHLEDIAMLATDALYATRRLSLDIGVGLGQWEEKIWLDLFITQPGVYWSPTELAKGGKPTIKSRGAPRSVIGDAAAQFVRRFDDWIAKLPRKVDGSPDLTATLHDRNSIPKVQVKVRVFHGCALALARGKPSLAGTWKHVPRDISFDWFRKRHGTWGGQLAGDGSDSGQLQDGAGKTSLLTMPISQSKLDESQGYEPIDFDRPIEIIGEDGRTETIDDEDLLFEAMPDHVQWLPRE
jgi:hypothetical protein